MSVTGFKLFIPPMTIMQLLCRVAVWLFLGDGPVSFIPWLYTKCHCSSTAFNTT